MTSETIVAAQHGQERAIFIPYPLKNAFRRILLVDHSRKQRHRYTKVAGVVIGRVRQCHCNGNLRIANGRARREEDCLFENG
jgi:hypothetical protein